MGSELEFIEIKDEFEGDMCVGVEFDRLVSKLENERAPSASSEEPEHFSVECNVEVIELSSDEECMPMAAVDVKTDPLLAPSVTISIVCTICRQFFNSADELERHMQTHNNDAKRRLFNNVELVSYKRAKKVKQFVCTLCSKAFCEEHNFKLHQRGCATIFQCETCFKSFKNRSSLKTHSVTHLGDLYMRKRL